MEKQTIKNILKVLLFLPLLIYIGERSPIAYDEGFYILQSKWILSTGDWVSPMYWRELILDRTIGIQYLIALSQKLFGENNFSPYIPNILAGSLMIFLTSKIHKQLLRDNSNIVSSLILSTTFLWINYFHMASQDLVFASIVTFGMFSTIKAFNSSKNIFFFTSGIWIGLAVMMKTYLTLIPFLSFLPFLISSKIIKNKLFWLGTLAGFLPFIVWSNSIINIHGYEQFSGLYSKLIFLSSKNNSTNPFYYYLWNLPINALPWSIFSIIGFLNIYKLKNKLASYFLFKFPLIMMLLLSMFSTKTPYYPIQILPLLSINSYLGLQYFLKENDFLKITFRKIIFFVFPITILFLLIFLNFKVINIDLENTDKLILSVGLLFFAVTWLLSESIKNIKYKIILIILGPYLLLSIAVQSGFLNDRSKEIRLVSEEIIKRENLHNKKVEFITTGPSDGSYEDATSKLIRIAIFMPKIGQGIDKMEELEKEQYGWTKLAEDKILSDNNFKLIAAPQILKPWKLILKK